MHSLVWSRRLARIDAWLDPRSPGEDLHFGVAVAVGVATADGLRSVVTNHTAVQGVLAFKGRVSAAPQGSQNKFKIALRFPVTSTCYDYNNAEREHTMDSARVHAAIKQGERAS
jgi:hypothetical protein